MGDSYTNREGGVNHGGRERESFTGKEGVEV
jgi:hypothetical protein